MGGNFIDLFAGCGGLSLGLIKAGWKGVFAIEKSPDAFLTLEHNLINGSIIDGFTWPNWLPKEAMTITALLENYMPKLKSLHGKIDLIAGGPPCQGFSFAGRRKENDPRNKLTEEYIKVVKLIKPKYLLLENVRGFQVAFKDKKNHNPESYSMVIEKKLTKLGYKVYHEMLNASLFRVPQPRARFIMIAIKEKKSEKTNPFEALNKIIPEYLQSKGLLSNNEITVSHAISDLEIGNKKLIQSIDTKGYYQINYKVKKLSHYQKLMRENCEKNYQPNSLRLTNHKKHTIDKYKYILDKCPKGKSLSKKHLEKIGTKKQCITPLHPKEMSKTLTTHPDDLLHYSEPRILTVREYARIQSFPDWFEFQGKYTTGGLRRRDECPRYTQVGNAVPPLMAEALGLLIKEVA